MINDTLFVQQSLTDNLFYLRTIRDFTVNIELSLPVKYQSYIDKQEHQIQRSKENLQLEIPHDFIYKGISGLSLEVIEKLSLIKPKTLQEAQRISGITPASLEVLQLHIALYHKKHKI